LGANIESGIFSRIRLIELKNIKAYSLLCLYISLDGYIGHFPNVGPGLFLLLEEFVKSPRFGLAGYFLSCGFQLSLRMISRNRISGIFDKTDRFSFFDRYGIIKLNPG